MPETAEKKPRMRSVPSGLDPCTGTQRYIRVPVEEKPKVDPQEDPTPTMDQLLPLDFQRKVPQAPRGRSTHAAHVAEGLEEAERRKDELAEHIGRKNEDIQ